MFYKLNSHGVLKLICYFHSSPGHKLKVNSLRFTIWGASFVSKNIRQFFRMNFPFSTEPSQRLTFDILEHLFWWLSMPYSSYRIRISDIVLSTLLRMNKGSFIKYERGWICYIKWQNRWVGVCQTTQGLKEISEKNYRKSIPHKFLPCFFFFDVLNRKHNLSIHTCMDLPYLLCENTRPKAWFGI